jgi:pimeloyl-ACP methyl ester carboxylesterase
VRGWLGLGRTVAAVAAGAGVVAASAAAGYATEQLVTRRRLRGPDPERNERFGSLRGRPLTVAAEDGVPLYVEVDGSVDAPLTLVWTHGYALNQDSFHYQRRDLGDLGRLVFWDQRGHGRSGRGASDTANIDQLGRDLAAVVDAVAPAGPLVLVGHSMGGMTVLALADHHPELFAERVVGVALMATSAGALGEITLGVPAYAAKALHRVMPSFVTVAARQPDLVERSRRAGSDLGYLLTKRYSFASDVSPSLVRFCAEMVSATPIEVIADFFRAFASHDKLKALDVLNGIETLVVAGEQDLLTPADHSRSMLDAVPGAELLVLDPAGHMLMLEHHEIVNERLRELVIRARAAASLPAVAG